ncbi:hypothetical protein HR060_00700 [Catenovulum sp. SM1970]|uniref:glycosyltransferase family 52 n=1 Tax=Marinifaba aquimaris TaxID=2741323 RepID=UPI001573F975|nr:glycosyltransferase family 52 [Marinifaba aquimaris]NTS75368.1 hypothetical protein [Marinifaba aquimaris]
MSQKVYICHTYYHLYTAILFAYREYSMCEKISKAVLSLHVTQNQKELFELKEVLTLNIGWLEFDFFDSYSLHMQWKELDESSKNKWGRNEENPYSSFINAILAKDIHIFTSGLLTQFILKQANKVNLIADGDYSYTYIPEIPEATKKRVSKLGFFEPYFLSPKISKIYNQKPELLVQELQNKSVQYSLNELELSLPKMAKENVINSFLESKVNFNKGVNGTKKTLIFLTSVLALDGICTEEEEVAAYEKVIAFYQAIGYQVFIKPHPRDKGTFSKLTVNNVTLLPQYLPIEVLNLLGEEIVDLLLCFCSTAVNNIMFAREVGSIFEQDDLIGDWKVAFPHVIDKHIQNKERDY